MPHIPSTTQIFQNAQIRYMEYIPVLYDALGAVRLKKNLAFICGKQRKMKMKNAHLDSMKNLFYNTMAATEMHACVDLAEITNIEVLGG